MVTLFKNRNLINLENFESVYMLHITSYTSLNGSEDPLFIERKSKIKLKQIIENSKIINSYSLTETEEKSNNEDYNKFFNKFSELSFITDNLCLERSLEGEMRLLTNMDQIEKKWKYWKQNKLYDFLPVLEEQEKFVASFESGLSYLKDNVKNELQYLILFPEFYRFKDYISSTKEYTGLFIFDSRLIRGITINYKLFLSHVTKEEFSQSVKIQMKSEITNKQELADFLKNLETQYTNITNYQFSINIFYNIEQSTGKILSAKLELIEKIAEGHDYKYFINLSSEKGLVNNKTEKIYKTYKGKEYTLEEWENFEQEQFNKYTNSKHFKTNKEINIEKEKNIKGNGFFLDEK